MKSKKIFWKSSKKFCHVLLVPAVSQRHTGVFPPFPGSKEVRNIEYDVLSQMWKRIWEQWNILPLVWKTEKAWTGKSVVQHGRREPLAIEHYFKRGFCYETIVHFLAEYHGISMNVRTLKRRLRHYGLRRRNHLHSEHTVREIIKREIEGLFITSCWISWNVEQAKNKLPCYCSSRHGHENFTRVGSRCIRAS